ncbi:MULTISPECIES: helix-turn-helix transcriptional regulator [unclassified Phyllobacterium]|uniref:helix-turn-helix domain-containing protein n=1 Tax=Phyllobacterium TaxID=28100 RepID=UPI000DDA8A78|nr:MULTISPECIES: helix-turn-helix transcriptional regulator [unclassified Phyllobacterium]MBA8901670.1 transcriptional regulator with XRE-family HTH domain [Phyllobacterium sp. P30BS-XVII]UGX88930.1 helix-turn-helix domain-containing protein [Phyllobacterium sp. T1293]
MNLGDKLRRLRVTSNVTQLDLALRLGISQRHVSFIERDRSRPSQALLTKWLTELNAPVSVTNAMLLLAGYTALHYSPQMMKSPSLRGMRGAIEAHSPMPAHIFCPEWHIMEINHGGKWLCSELMPDYMNRLGAAAAHIDMIDCLTADDGLLSQLLDPVCVALAFLNQLRVEEWVTPDLRPRIDRFEKSLWKRFNISTQSRVSEAVDTHLVLRFNSRFGPLSFFTIQTVPGLPQDVTISSPRAELWFADDQKTREIIYANCPPVPDNKVQAE